MAVSLETRGDGAYPAVRALPVVAGPETEPGALPRRPAKAALLSRRGAGDVGLCAGETGAIPAEETGPVHP